MMSAGFWFINPLGGSNSEGNSNQIWCWWLIFVIADVRLDQLSCLAHPTQSLSSNQIQAFVLACLPGWSSPAAASSKVEEQWCAAYG